MSDPALNNLVSMASASGSGFQMPSMAYIFGTLIFGILGYAAYRYGKKTERMVTRWMGFSLMVFPYAVSQTWMLYAVGIALCGAMYYFRDE